MQPDESPVRKGLSIGQHMHENEELKQSDASSLIENLSIGKLKYESIDIFFASLNMADVSLELMRKKIGQYIYYLDVRKNNKSIWRIRRSQASFTLLFLELSKKYYNFQYYRQFNQLTFSQTSLDPVLVLNFLVETLDTLLKTPPFSKEPILLSFLEVSFVPLEKGSKKFKECYILKRAGGRYKGSSLYSCGFLSCMLWSKRWLVIRQDGVLYTLGPTIDKSSIREILFFDSSFRIEYGKNQTGNEKGIILTASSRKLHLKALDFLEYYDIISSLKEACENCCYTQINRFLSFSPPRINNSYCKWYIDGENYYNDVYEVLIRAREEIFIADWWLSPELFLKRPISAEENQNTRLDLVLKKCAENGVKINIILYREVKLALSNDSYYTKKTLQGLHKNIRVLRHPRDYFFLWSHHEKIIIVDQEIAFLGGLDLCYGRYDTRKHLLKDFNCDDNEKFEGMFPGIDYYNVRIEDFSNVRNYTKSNLDKKKDCRMPWHDVAIRVIGEPVKDLTRHFIQYWNFVTYDLTKTSKKKQNYLEVIVNEERKNHSQTIHHLMESSFLKKQRQSNEKSEKKKKKFMEKIHDKIKQTTNTVKSLWNKEKRKTSTSAINTNQMQIPNLGIKNLRPSFSLNPEKVSEVNKEKEELLLSKKKVVYYLANSMQAFENALSQSQQGNSDNLGNLEEISESVDDRGIDDENRKNLNNNVFQKNHLNFHVSNWETLNFPSNNNLSINKIQETFVHQKLNDNMVKLNGNIPRSPTNDKKIKKNVAFRKSFTSFGGKDTINPLKIILNPVSGTFEDECEKDNNFLNPKPKYYRNVSKSHQIIEDIPGSNTNLNNEQEKNDFKKQLEIFSTINFIPSDTKLFNKKTTKDKEKDKKETENLQINYFIKVHKKNDAHGIKNIISHKFQNLKENFTNFHIKNKKPQQQQIEEEIEPSISPKKKKKFLKKKNANNDNMVKTMVLTPNPKKNDSTNDYLKTKLTCSCQILRSSSSWSLGLGPYQTEKSIHMAYVQLIEQSKHYVYIENQFFISNLAGSPVENLIAKALLLRIKEAYKNDEIFKVFIFLPLLPGFPGEIDRPTAAILKIQLYWEYMTISRGGSSLLEELEKENIPAEDFIVFLSLRTHELIGNEPKTEIIYIHSKMMLVDDKFCLIGSANINDRSMMGSRDSEIGIVVEDSKKIPSKMNNKDYEASDFIFNLRINLFKEHFGFDKEELIDPIDQDLWNKISARADQNTNLYREIFGCYPDNEIKTMAQIETVKAKAKPNKYNELKDKIKGHAVIFPINFLENQSLKLPIFAKEYIVPDINFV